jgi:F-type H+-transporting ATPase subunit b
VEILAVAGATSHLVATYASEAEASGMTINWFWVLASAATFVLFLAIIWPLAFKPMAATLAARQARIAQGLEDADAARRDRESAADQRQAVIAEARREANEVLARAQRVAEESREQGIAETRAEIERLRAQAVAEIEAERLRTLAEIRTQVADLALRAAGRVVGETMTSERERRLVDEFLTQMSPAAPTASDRN